MPAPPAPFVPSPAPRIDLHVHLVGSGSAGTGCCYPDHGRYRWMVPLLMRWNGIQARVLREDFDTHYTRRLARYVRESSLDGAVLLALDAPHDERGCVIQNTDAFVSPNAAVLRVAAKHPEFLPGISIHPARADAFDLLERGLAAGAALLKLIPACQNIDLLDPRYARFWARLAEAGLPLLVHTGPEPALEELRPEFGDFHRLRAPLEAGVTVIAAHCGGAKFQDDFAAALPRWPRLFGDTAAFCVPFSKRRLAPLRAPEVAARLVHGSDVPAPVSAAACAFTREIAPLTALRLMRCGNPLERDLRLKRALGLPEASPERSARVLRPAALDLWRERRAAEATQSQPSRAAPAPAPASPSRAEAPSADRPSAPLPRPRTS